MPRLKLDMDTYIYYSLLILVITNPAGNLHLNNVFSN